MLCKYKYFMHFILSGWPCFRSVSSSHGKLCHDLRDTSVTESPRVKFIAEQLSKLV